MPEFRLTQISDPHLSRNQPKLTENFHRVSEYIDARRPDLVINTGDVAFDVGRGVLPFFQLDAVDDRILYVERNLSLSRVAVRREFAGRWAVPL